MLAHPVRRVLRREQGLQVIAAQHAGIAPVHGGGLHLQQPHGDVAVQEAQPLQQEFSARTRFSGSKGCHAQARFTCSGTSEIFLQQQGHAQPWFPVVATCH